MAFDVLYIWPAANIVQDGTLTVSYPAGRAAADYKPSPHFLSVSAHQAKYANPDDFTLTFGVSNITLTYKRATVIPAFTDLQLQIERVVGASDSSAESAAASASAAAASAVEAEGSATAAAGSADDADSASSAAAGYAAAASLHAGNAADTLADVEAVRDEIEELTTDFLTYGTALAVTASRDLASTDLSKDLEVDLVTAGGDVTIELPEDVYTDATATRRKSINILVDRGGTARKLILRPKLVAASASPTAPTNSGSTVARDASPPDASGPNYTAALPAVTVTAAAGDDRLLLYFVGVTYFTGGDPTTNPSLSATVDGFSGTNIKNFPNPLCPGVLMNLAAGYYPLGSNVAQSTHTLNCSVGVSKGRNSMFIAWCVVADALQANPIHALVTQNDGIALSPTDGSDNEWKNECVVTTTQNYCRVISLNAWDSQMAAEQTVESGTKVLYAATGAVSGGDMAAHIIQSEKATAGVVTHKSTISKDIRTSASSYGYIGFGVLPATAPADITLKNDAGTVVSSIDITNDVVLRLHADGQTYRVLGA